MNDLQLLEKLNILDKLDEKISSLQTNVSAMRYEMDSGFKSMEKRLDKVEDDVHIVRLDIENRILPRIDAMGVQQDVHYEKSRTVGADLDHRVTDLESRVGRLEEKAAG